MIIRGTTAYYDYSLPVAADEISELYITYSQNGEVIVEKTLEDIVVEDHMEPLVPEDSEQTEETEDIEEDEEEAEEVLVRTSTIATVYLTQEDTLKFQFYPAAEKNIALAQVRILATNNEAYATIPVKERIYGVLKEGVIGQTQTEEESDE